ncbi:MAG: leucine--tRNA ligase, partial [Thermoprotei archaeon]|nr:leucine--tRNA ligase [Thermoprotei archaeon]
MHSSVTFNYNKVSLPKEGISWGIIFYTIDSAEEFLKVLRDIERKWQQKWEEAHLFEAEPDPNKKKFFLTVPYPYTSGPLHIGHGRTYTIGDLIARFMRMRGFNVLWPMAFHITGTPIASISARISRGDEECIKLYENYVRLYIKDEKEVRKVVESFVEPKNVAMFFANAITNDFKSLGYSIDWRRKFTTGDPDYSAFITWQFMKLKEKGYIVQGTHPVLYCPKDKNAVGEDDIRGGDEFRAEVVEFTAIKFRLEGDDEVYLVAGTLRPETIFGVTNIWVNPRAEYVLVNVDGEKWIVSEEAADKLRYQGHEVSILRRIKGSELVGKRCFEPISGREILILPAVFVSSSEATGVVYSVPAHSPHDYVALRDIKRDPERFGISAECVSKIEPISIIDIDGYSEWPARDVVEKMGIRDQTEREKLEEATKILYKEEYYKGILKDICKPFNGMRIAEAKEKVREWLLNMGKATIFYETSPRPIYCRCGSKIVVAVLKDQWFINYGNPEWKKLAREALSKMEIYPAKYRKLFEDTFDWLALRPCARKRGLGTPLPFDKGWIIESLSDSTIYMAFYTVVHIIRRYGIKPEQLTLDVFDYVFLGKGDPKIIAKRTGIPVDALKEMRKEFTYWYPVDQRHTAVGHITNHLSFFIFHHVAIFPKELWPKKITLNEYVIREGAKMSKSKGNVLPLVEIPRKYSADLFRLYIVYAADLPSVVDWREAQVKSVLRRLMDFWNLAINICEHETAKPKEMSIPTRGLLSRINSAISLCTTYMEKHKLRDYVQEAFFNMLNNIELYLKMVEGRPEYEKEKWWALRYCLERLVKLLSPVIPHISEELWELLGHKGFVSVEKWPTSDEEYIDMELEEIIEIVNNTIEDIKNILDTMKEAKPSKAYIYVGAAPWKYKLSEMVYELRRARIDEIIR